MNYRSPARPSVWIRIFCLWLLVATVCWAEPLTQWKGPNRQRIIEFVERVSQEDSKDYIAPSDRIAVFDNDGTMMAEQPLYFPLIFATDQVRREAVVNPSRRDDATWKGDPVIQSILTGDNAAAIPMGSERLLARLFPGLGTDQFTSLARGWLKQARHPRFNRPYDQLVYTPMLELHRYLREHGFTVYICSGAGEEWVRSFSETAYELPPERVLGTVTKLKFVQSIDGAGLVREPELLYRCDGPGKPIAIQQRLGRRPVLAFGNSDGDLEMLQFVAGQSRPHLCLLLHHDDGDREYAYDRESKVGRLDKAWNEALSQGWAIVSMKNDWSSMFAAPGE